LRVDEAMSPCPRTGTPVQNHRFVLTYGYGRGGDTRFPKTVLRSSRRRLVLKPCKTIGKRGESHMGESSSDPIERRHANLARSLDGILPLSVCGDDVDDGGTRSDADACAAGNIGRL